MSIANSFPVTAVYCPLRVPLKVFFAGARFGRRAVQYIQSKHRANQEHAARTKMIRLVCRNYADQTNSLAMLRENLHRGEVSIPELDRNVKNILSFVELLEKRGQLDQVVSGKYRYAVKDREGYKQVIRNVKYLPKAPSGAGLSCQAQQSKHEKRCGKTFADSSLGGHLVGRLNENEDRDPVTVCRQKTDKLDLYLPQTDFAPNETIKVMVTAHGVAVPGPFKILGKPVKLNFFSHFGESASMKLDKVAAGDVNESYDLTKGHLAQDYMLSSFTGIKSSSRVNVVGKPAPVKSDCVPVEDRRNARLKITEASEHCENYVKETSSIVISPRLVDDKNNKVNVSLSEVYSEILKRYPNNPIEIDCSFCRGM